MALDDFRRSLPMLLYRALDAVMPVFRHIFNAHGLTEQQWRVLRVLAEENALPLRTLSALTAIPAPSLVGVVDRLQAAGLVDRRRSETDRRSVAVTITATGRELESALAPEVRAAYAALMQTLEPREWIRLIDGLEKIAASRPSD